MKEGGWRGGEEKFSQEHRMRTELRRNGAGVGVFAFPCRAVRILTSVHSNPQSNPAYAMAKSADNEESKVVAARNKNLDLVLQTIAKEYGEGAIMRLGDSTKMDVEVIPTGNILIDRALGAGGFPRGRVVEVFGPES